MENPFEEEQQKPKRPTLLTVLCILTFIGAGFNILSALFLSFLPDDFSATMQSQFADMLGDDKAEQMVASMTLAMRTAPYLLVLSIVNLAGAILMFGLKRLGLLLYVVAQIAMLIMPAMMTGAWSGIILSAVWTLLFIGLYASNLKYMK